MSFDFTIYNQNFANPFEYDIPKGTPFVQLMDLDENHLYRLRQIYINPKAKYGPHPVAGIEFDNEYSALWVSLPARMVQAVENLLSREEAIQAINQGECGFRIRNFHSEKYDKDGTALNFVNITADAPVSRTLSHPVLDSSHSVQGATPPGEVHSQNAFSASTTSTTSPRRRPIGRHLKVPAAVGLAVPAITRITRITVNRFLSEKSSCHYMAGGFFGLAA